MTTLESPQPPPVTLERLQELLSRVLDRLARVETRLVRLMLDAGLDENGHPLEH